LFLKGSGFKPRRKDRFREGRSFIRAATAFAIHSGFSRAAGLSSEGHGFSRAAKR